ncbi:MAG TPA: hypothetical protein VFK42_18095 [Acidimicrobiales bacterium]|nr:hypothetical protein [Acidimicrobiales bacterium]
MIARAYTGLRFGAGVGLLVAPRLGARLLGDPGERATFGRLLGVRDLALVAAALATPPKSTARRWAMTACAAADAGDAIVAATNLRRHRRPVAALTLATSIAGAATGAWLATSLRRRET